MPTPIKKTDLVYFPVPKVACSSIKYAILNYNEDGLADRMPAKMPSGKIVRYAHDAYPSKDLRLTDISRYIFRNCWFAVVRDPLKRFLSGYSNRVIFYRDMQQTNPVTLARAGLSVTPDLEDFVTRLEEYLAINRSMNHHLRPMHRYLGRKPQRFDRIFAMSELDQITPYCAEAGAFLDLPYRQAGGPKLSLSELTPAMREKLMAFYAEDYRIWGPYLDG